MEASVDPQPPGSRLDADYPENGVLIPRRNTADDNPVDERRVTTHQLADLFGIERLRHGGEPAKIGEKYGDLPTLACRKTIGMHHARRRCHASLGDCRQ